MRRRTKALLDLLDLAMDHRHMKEASRAGHRNTFAPSSRCDGTPRRLCLCNPLGGKRSEIVRKTPLGATMLKRERTGKPSKNPRTLGSV